MIDLKTQLKKITFSIISLLLICTHAMAQPTWKVDLDGGVKDEDTKQMLEGAKLEILKGASIVKSFYTNEKGKFQYFLEPNNSYVVKVSYTGYVTKLIAVSTENVPDKVDISGNFIVKMQVSLFREVPGIDFSLLDKPIGSIFYEPRENNFGYDVDASVGERLAQLQKEYEKNMKERVAQAKRDKEDGEKKVIADKLAAERAEKEAKKNAAKQASDSEREEKKRKADEEKIEKEKKQAKVQNQETEKLANDSEDEKKKQNEQERAARKELEKVAYEEAQAKLKLKAEEKKEREIKAKEAVLEKIKEKGLKKQAVVQDVAAKHEVTVIAVENIRTSQSEGVNYTIDHTFVTINGEEIEYKKIVYAWGGTYYKRADLDVPDNTFIQEMKMYGIEVTQQPK
jgi:CarboxypepD_reg-like domain